MSNVAPIQSYQFTPQDRVLLDTNIWLTVECPLAQHVRLTPVYSSALAKLLSKGSSIYVDVLVISEFANRYARYEHKFYCDAGGTENFKAYRRGHHFPGVAKNIAQAVRRIMGRSSCVESGLSSLNLDEFLSQFEAIRPDFNDQVLAQLCKAQHLKLITHDFDFAALGVPIITANQKLLN